MSSNDDQPVTDGKPAPEPKRFEVHISDRLLPFTVDCHDFREVGHYLQFSDENGNPVAVFPSGELVAAIRVQAPVLNHTPSMPTEQQKHQLRAMGIAVKP